MCSKFTLTMMLVMFVCQIFATCVNASVQYPSGTHPLGDKIAHHHNHGEKEHHSHQNINDQLIETNEDDAEHEHANHSHLSCFPPVDNSLLSSTVIAEIIANELINYPDCNYAPLIPPPSI